ncbi:transposase [Actinomadura cellulosilytica]|uniref:Transposase n=1 Tax=Thermomonospora cellulosilytica TaxID=1411118 RepID=A0A7W3MX00_9ACTN|nr:transposase [Thermomonospora cellulosilytica]MBA9003474.1 transposase [Thermomonospora cellulosilytica]
MDRGKPGSKLHVLSDRRGLPLMVGLSAGDVHDGHGLRPMVAGHMRQASEKGPSRRIGKLHADKAYDQTDLRRWLARQRIKPRIARKGIEPDDRLGRHRWVVERTIAWLLGYRRLTLRYERHPRNYLAFLGLAAALTCYKRLIKLTT